MKRLKALAVTAEHELKVVEVPYHDLMLYAEFTDKEALARYMDDGRHKAIRDWDQQYVCDRAGFDYECNPKS